MPTTKRNYKSGNKTKRKRNNLFFNPEENIESHTVGSKMLLHPNTTTKVSLSHPFGVYDKLRLVGMFNH